ADELLADGTVLTFGKESLTVLHTPGHTPGGVCLLGSGVLFSGDTLFAGSVGRTDFPGGSMEQLLDGIRRKLLPLPDDTAVYPGHGGATRIGWERENNPYFV
ncbi:MAG: MBL fold metallo-hydrolase, partial [Selenomonadaceae bacterium]